MQQILTDIFTWSWFSEPHQYDFDPQRGRQSLY